MSHAVLYHSIIKTKPFLLHTCYMPGTRQKGFPRGISRQFATWKAQSWDSQEIKQLTLEFGLFHA
jgi:hypothetical protein